MAMAQYATIILPHINQQQGRRTLGRYHLIDRAVNLKHRERWGWETMCGRVAPHWGTDWNGDDNGQICRRCWTEYVQTMESSR
jgi:hypothetical protein